MAEPPIGTRLRTALEEKGWSYTRLIAEMRKVASRQGKTLPTTASLIAMLSRWLNGHERPQPVLSRDPQRCARARPGRARVRQRPRAYGHAARRQLGESPTCRRTSRPRRRCPAGRLGRTHRCLPAYGPPAWSGRPVRGSDPPPQQGDGLSACVNDRRRPPAARLDCRGHRDADGLAVP
jgi:hypothetical protein